MITTTTIIIIIEKNYTKPAVKVSVKVSMNRLYSF